MKADPYPEYKPSGVEWLGDVPDTWDVKRTRFVSWVNPPAIRLRDLDSDDEVSFVPMEAVGEYGGLRLDQSKPIFEVGAGFTEFQEGDVVVAKITPCFENGKGAIACGLVNGAAFGTTELHVLRAKKMLNNRFLFYFTICNAYRKLGEAEMYGAGGQKRVPPAYVRDFPIPLPPLSEQQTIADFLDAETAKLDGLIEKKRTLIERLKEKRSALISRTVTRGLPADAAAEYGLDPNPPLKASGIDWLGDIPAHWNLRRLKDHGRIISGSGFPHEYQGIEDELLPFYKVSDMSRAGNERYMAASANSVSMAMAKDLRASVIPPRSIIYAKIGAALFLNKRRITTRDCCIDNNMTAFVPAYAEGEWSFYWLLTLDFGEYANPGAVPSLSEGYQSTLPFLCPPTDEQRMIADYLDREMLKIDQLITKVEDAIERLQEYRSALITAAVTGKIDVRSVVA